MKFQSHLTGIEMSTYQSVQQHRQGSNRTLLELKYLENRARSYEP